MVSLKANRDGNVGFVQLKLLVKPSILLIDTWVDA